MCFIKPFNAQSEQVNQVKSEVITREITKEDIISLIDDPVLVKIAHCESNMRQFEKDGSVVKNYQGSPDYGLFQIHQVHFKEVERLGIDIMTLEGNIEFAKILYKRAGVRPWLASEKCWSKMI